MLRPKDDTDEIIELFHLYKQKMYHIAYAILHDSYLAEDAVMDAFVRLLERHYDVADLTSDTTKRLVITVTRTASIDLYRKNQRAREREILTDDPDANRREQFSVPEYEFSGNVESMIQTLPSIYRDVLHERYAKGSSTAETAALRPEVQKRGAWH